MTTASSSRIRFSCDCGKKYFCRPRNAGKRLRCRHCGQVLAVPQDSFDVNVQDDDFRHQHLSDSLDGAAPRFDTLQDQKNVPSSFKPLEVVREDGFEITERGRNIYRWCFTWGLVSLAIVVMVSVYQTTLNGPQFLGFFQIVFWCGVVSVFTMGFLASKYRGSYLLAVLLTFELIAIVRIGYGMSQGMHNFANLLYMMIVGPIAFVFLAFATACETSGSSSDGGSCSSGSSCGGGGGGCGGCSG
jgi:uncharacterized membrane protein YgcG